MKFKSLLIGLMAIGLAGCNANYDFYPDKKANEKYEQLSEEDQSIVLKGASSTLKVKSLEKEVGPWNAPRMEFSFTNDTEDRIMVVKTSDLRVGFSGFWFDVVDYRIVQKDRPEELSFQNDENFKYEHEVLPQETIVIEATFETPKSEEYYTKKQVLIEAYTNLDIFNVIYKIKRTRK